MLLMALLMLWPLRLSAETVLVPAVDSPQREYLARLRASSSISPVQSYIKQHPLPASRDALLEVYTSAQRAYLEADRTQAQTRFEQVLEHLPKEDWSKSEREIFLTAYLRLAQLDAARRDYWLLRALQLGPGLVADRSLFPPPLLAQLERLRTETPQLQIQPPQDWTRLLINGISCSRGNCPAWPDIPGSLRVTFLSDRYIPQTLHMSAADISKANPERTPWLEGPCAQPRFHARADLLGPKQPFWRLDCDLPENKPLNMHVQARAAPEGLALPEAPAEPKPVYKNKWFWAGVGAVAAVVIANALKKSETKEEKQTSTSYGY